MHGQTDHFLGQPFAHRRAASGDREALVGLLAMQRDRVVNRGWDALNFERGCEPVAAAGRKALKYSCSPKTNRKHEDGGPKGEPGHRSSGAGPR